MEYRIEHIVEPERLLLRWQSTIPDLATKRTHWIVGELLRNNDGVDLRYFMDDEDLMSARELNFSGHPSFKLKMDLHEGTLDVFRRRLPPRARTDFRDYLDFFFIPRETEISDFALLGYTGAKLPSDGFSIIHPFDGIEGPCEFLTEIAGFRYYVGADENINVGRRVEFEEDPTNRFDPEAIKMLYQGRQIGYITKGHTMPMKRWLRSNRVQAEIARINGMTLGKLTAYIFVYVA